MVTVNLCTCFKIKHVIGVQLMILINVSVRKINSLIINASAPVNLILLTLKLHVHMEPHYNKAWYNVDLV